MIHLIKLELKKGRLSSYFWGPIITYGAIAGFMLLLYFTEGNNTAEPAFLNLTEMLQIIDIFVRGTFIIYASTLLSKLVISEFRDNTMALLFTYPVSRQKLIFAKLSMVFLWTFANVIIANLVVGIVLVPVNAYFGYVSDPLTSQLLYQHGTYVLMQAFGAAGISLLPLYFGMRKKSAPATIVSSFLIGAIVCSNNMGFSLSSIIAIPLTLAVLGILISYMSFRNIDQTDVA